MTTIVLYIAASLDGYVADPDGSVAWLEEFDDDYPAGVDGESSYESFFASVDCLVMGSHTYEQIVTEFIGEDADPADAWPYGDRPTYVTTGRDLPRASDAVEFYDGDLAALVADLDAHDTVWLVGGAALARSFLREGLLDEIRLSVVPVLRGDGIALFGGDEIAAPLHLLDVTAFESGIVELRYAVGSA